LKIERTDVDGFAKVMSLKDVLENKCSLSLQLYVKQVQNNIFAVSGLSRYLPLSV
jgi:hypothetical protein